MRNLPKYISKSHTDRDEFLIAKSNHCFYLLDEVLNSEERVPDVCCASQLGLACGDVTPSDGLGFSILTAGTGGPRLIGLLAG